MIIAIKASKWSLLTCRRFGSNQSLHGGGTALLSCSARARVQQGSRHLAQEAPPPGIPKGIQRAGRGKDRVRDPCPSAVAWFHGQLDAACNVLGRG